MGLAPDRIPSHEQFFDALQNTPDVAKVEWKETKTSQGNVGNHYMERNINVWVTGFERPMEFELTRNLHKKPGRGAPYTVSACFKAPPIKLHADAWRILLDVVKDRELMPMHGRQACAGQGCLHTA